MALSNNLTPASSRKTTKDALLRLRASRFDRYHTGTPGHPRHARLDEQDSLVTFIHRGIRPIAAIHRGAFAA